MRSTQTGEARGEPDPISQADYLGHEGRLIKLEEFRKAHEKTHDDHVATHAWVYKTGFALVALIATIAASIGAAAVRAIFGS